MKPWIIAGVACAQFAACNASQKVGFDASSISDLPDTVVMPTSGTASYAGAFNATRAGDPTSGFVGDLAATVDFGAPKSINLTASNIQATDKANTPMTGTLAGTGTIAGNTLTSPLNGSLQGGGETQQLALTATGTFKSDGAKYFVGPITGTWTNLDFPAGTNIAGTAFGTKQ